MCFLLYILTLIRVYSNSTVFARVGHLYGRNRTYRREYCLIVWPVLYYFRENFFIPGKMPLTGDNRENIKRHTSTLSQYLAHMGRVKQRGISESVGALPRHDT